MSGIALLTVRLEPAMTEIAVLRMTGLTWRKGPIGWVGVDGGKSVATCKKAGNGTWIVRVTGRDFPTGAENVLVRLARVSPTSGPAPERSPVTVAHSLADAKRIAETSYRDRA